MSQTMLGDPALDQKTAEAEVAHSQSPVADHAAGENAGYDHTEPQMGRIALWGLVMIVSLIAVILGVQTYFDRVNQRQVFTRIVQPVAEDLEDIRTKENARLHSYQWVDVEAGLVRLPIERGMELLAAEFAARTLRYSTEPEPDLEPRP